MARGDPQIAIRLPHDAKAFIAAQAARNGSSQNSEIVRCIRDRMECVASVSRIVGTDQAGNGVDKEIAATGDEIGVQAPAAAEDHRTRKECCDAANT